MGIALVLVGLGTAAALLLVPVRLHVDARLRGRHLAVDARGQWLALRLRRSYRWAVPRRLRRRVLRWLLARDGGELVLDRSRLGRAREAAAILAGLGRAGLPALRHLAGRLRLDQVRATARIGGRDALETALACGAGWALLAQVAAALRARANLDAGALYLSLEPDFQSEQVLADLTVRARVRPLHLLQAGWIAVRAGAAGALRRGLRRLRGGATCRRLPVHSAGTPRAG